MITERRKKRGVCYAVTDDGLELPVIDMTHPAFAPTERAEDLPAIAEASLRGLKRATKMPLFIRRFLSRGSVFAVGTMRPTNGVLAGMTTYLYKLGPDNLGRSYSNSMDRKIASSVAAVSMRMRLRTMAHFASDILEVAMSARSGRPVRIIEIAGGTAIDGLNACILLCKRRRDLLVGRKVQVMVLERDEAGPHFGARALEALRAEGGPLCGDDISLVHLPYDWAESSALRQVVEGIERDDVAICLSEGGLFEYGSDAEIAANLEVLREGAADDCRIVGSMVRDTPILRAMQDKSAMNFRILDLETLSSLAARTGWMVEQVDSGAPLYHVVKLKKRSDGAAAGSCQRG